MKQMTIKEFKNLIPMNEREKAVMEGRLPYRVISILNK